MATIQTRKNKKGITHTAQVRVRGHKAVFATFKRKTDAKAWAAKKEDEIRRSLHDSPSQAKKPLAACMGEYMDTVSRHKAANTHRREKDCEKAIMDFFGRAVRVSDITPKHVAAYRDRRLQSVGAHSVRLELALLSHVYETAIREWGLPVANPVKRIKRPPTPQGRTQFLTEAEAQALLEVCGQSRNPMLRPYVRLLLHTGMRPSEGAALKWADFDFDRRIITLVETKNGEVRKVPMTAAIQAEFRTLWARREGKRVFLPEGKGKGAGRTVPATYFRSAWETARKKAGLAHIHLHDLRHTAASHLLMAGVDLRTLAEILGHKSMKMVQRYTHLLDGHIVKAIDALGSLGMETNEKADDDHPPAALRLVK